MDDILRQAERLFFRSSVHRKRVAEIANRYLENTAKANKVNAQDILDKSIRAEVFGDSNIPSKNISATRMRRMGFSNG